MKKVFAVFFSIALLALSVSAQTRSGARPTPRATPSKIPTAVPVKPGTSVTPISGAKTVDPGSVSGRTYTNTGLGFSVTFPDTWLIPDKDFDEYMKSRGFDLHIADPETLGPQYQADVRRFKKYVTVLLTAFRSMPGTTDNAIVIIAAEDLTPNPQVKDGVDYIDAIRKQFKTMRLPPDFTYSETQAEQLGTMQFAFLDTSVKAQKKRLYVTVRNGYAILLTLTYNTSDDLGVFRRVLDEGDFHLKNP